MLGMTAIGVLGAIGVAVAQEVPEGDFESAGDLVGWTTTGGVYEANAGIGGSGREMRVPGWGESACSSLFVVTRTSIEVSVLHDGNSPSLETQLELRDAAGTLLTSDSGIVTWTGYRNVPLDVSAWCGVTALVCVAPLATDEFAYDDFQLSDDACPDWADADGDGACPLGRDLDGDGACADPGEWDDPASDCDDQNPTRSPFAAELCNGIDEDCDLVVDDGFDEDGDGFSTCEGDCDDADDGIHPDAVEVLCNGIDDDCSPSTADGPPDGDGDGWSVCDGDCDDGDRTVYPGAADPPDDGVDRDCDGEDGEAAPGTPGDSATGDPATGPGDSGGDTPRSPDPYPGAPPAGAPSGDLPAPWFCGHAGGGEGWWAVVAALGAVRLARTARRVPRDAEPGRVGPNPCRDRSCPAG